MPTLDEVRASKGLAPDPIDGAKKIPDINLERDIRRAEAMSKIKGAPSEGPATTESSSADDASAAA